MSMCLPGLRAAEFSWQQPQAEIDPKGDLSWAPKPFEFGTGETVRYIDFENGDDANDGASKESAWRHHPWDANAEGNAAEASGPITYVFKGGVTYRGFLEADDSGSAEEPIRLTRDPSWGEGEAVLSGAEVVEGAWKKATTKDVPEGMPTEGVWYIDLEADAVEPRALWTVDDIGGITRIDIARGTLEDSKTSIEELYAWQFDGPFLKDFTGKPRNFGNGAPGAIGQAD